MFLIIVLYILFASTFTIGKLALEVAHPLFFVGVRMLLGGSLLLGFTYFFKPDQWKLRRSDWLLYLQLMVIHIYISFALEFWALQYISAAKACLLYNLSPFITALYAYSMFHEKLNRQKWIGLFIGFIGMLPIILTYASGDQGSIISLTFPEFGLLGAVASSALGWILLSKAMQKGYAAFMANGIAMLGGGVLSFISSLMIEGHPTLMMPKKYALNLTLAHYIGPNYAPLVLFIFYTLLLVIIANIVCYNLYGYLLRRFTATFLSFAGFITPLFAACFDYLLLGYRISGYFLASFLITTFGLYIFYQQELQRNR